MAEIDRSLRFRAFLNEWFAILLVALLILTVLTGWWAYSVNLDPTVETEQRLTEQWSESTSYSHSVEIQREATPFPAGEVIENRPLYYTATADSLDGIYRYEYQADSGNVELATETFLLIQAGEFEDGRIEDPFWEVTEPLRSDSDRIEPGETHTVRFSVDIQSVLETIATVEAELDSTQGQVDVRVISVTERTGTVEGESVEDTYQSEMPMVVEPATFRVAETETIDETHESFETVEVLAAPSPLSAYGSIILFGLMTALLLATGGLRYTGYTELTEDEAELLEITQARERFSEWITTGEFPSEREYEETVLVDDLEGLVDVAIDTNKRVIEDTQLGVYTVLDDAYIYIYIRPDSAARGWLVNYADTTLDEVDEYDF